MKVTTNSSQFRYSVAFCVQPVGQPRHTRRLAGAAHTEVADTDDWGIQLPLFEPSGFIEPRARAHAACV